MFKEETMKATRFEYLWLNSSDISQVTQKSQMSSATLNSDTQVRSKEFGLFALIKAL